MTEERLKELIKQGGWIWILDKGCRFGLQVDDKFFVKDNFLRSGLGTKYAKLNDIFETKEQAEWALKTVTERTERFEPPMWEDLSEFKFNFLTKNENGIYEEMRFLAIKHENFNEIILRNEFLEDYIIYDIHATKENYIKACEMVRDLFKEGK